MAKVDVLDWDRKKVGSVELSADVFEQPVKKTVLHTVVKWQLAKRRQGTHSTLKKGEVSGGGKKPFKQKGTGNARQGSSRSPLNPGGGVIFGPKPRNYGYELPKKVKQAGLRSALSYLNGAGKLFVVDKFESDGKTKNMASTLKKFGVTKAVLIDATGDLSVSRAARNLDKYRYYSVDGLNVYDLLKYDTAILAKGAVSEVEKRCGRAE